MSDRSQILVESIVSGGAVSQITGNCSIVAGNFYFFEYMVIDTIADTNDSTFLQFNNNITASQYRNTLFDSSNSSSINSNRVAMTAGTGVTIVQSGHGYLSIENSVPVLFSLNQQQRTGRHARAGSHFNNTDTFITSFQVYKASGNYIANGSYFRIWNAIQDTV